MGGNRGERPLLFETAAFLEGRTVPGKLLWFKVGWRTFGPDVDGCWLTSTWNEAEQAHLDIVKLYEGDTSKKLQERVKRLQHSIKI